MSKLEKAQSCNCECFAFAVQQPRPRTEPEKLGMTRDGNATDVMLDVLDVNN